VSDINRTCVGHHPNTRRRSTDHETSEINRNYTVVSLAGQGSNLQPLDPKSSVLPVELPATGCVSA